MLSGCGVTDGELTRPADAGNLLPSGGVNILD
jgi:hypothetical protein